jgi:hypothetical protein
MIENVSHFPMRGATPVPVDSLLLTDFTLRRSSSTQLTGFFDLIFSEQHRSHSRIGGGSEMSAE